MLKLFGSNNRKHDLPKRFWTIHDLSESEYDKLSDKRSYKNIKGPEFKKYITKYLSQRLREIGFQGSGYNFKKSEGHYIYTIQMFGDKWGGQGWVEVGVHLDFLPNSINNPIEFKKIQTIDCFIRHSLSLKNGNQMIDYGIDELESKESIDLIFDMIITDGIPYFQLFKNFPSPFDQIILDDLKSNNPKFSQYKLHLDSMLTTLHLARIKHFMGLKEEAKDIAEYGKTQVDGISGSGLIIYLNKIIRGDNSFFLNEVEQEIVRLEHEKLRREIFGK